MKRNLSFVALLGALCGLILSSCGTQTEVVADRHAEWVYNSVVYEMNVRQQTAEGTFAAAEERLPFLKELGVDIIWLMPIHPIGEKGRKGTLGSYYAIKNYREINPEFGTMADFERFLNKAHELGFKVILDYVANHTSPDAAWVTEKPAEWYVRDSVGEPVVQYDWWDIAKLNYACEDVRKEMKEVQKFWIEKGVDGFRCDVAGEMPDPFWTESWNEIRAINPDVYFLAEGEGSNFHADGFDACYAWKLKDVMNNIAQGKQTTGDLKQWIEEFTTEYPREAIQLMFTSNHDENSWSGTEFERLGAAAKTFAALTYVLPQGQPLIYTGQEVGYDHRFEFFEKDPIPGWEANEYTDFYRTLNELRHTTPALWAGEKGGELVYLTGVVEEVLAFTREVEGSKALCLFNLSAEPQSVIPTVAAAGEYTCAMTGEKATIEAGKELHLEPWAYVILTK